LDQIKYREDKRKEDLFEADTIQKYGDMAKKRLEIRVPKYVDGSARLSSFFLLHIVIRFFLVSADILPNFGASGTKISQS
jgi:hypothetical protein